MLVSEIVIVVVIIVVLVLLFLVLVFLVMVVVLMVVLVFLVLVVLVFWENRRGRMAQTHSDVENRTFSSNIFIIDEHYPLVSFLHSCPQVVCFILYSQLVSFLLSYS